MKKYDIAKPYLSNNEIKAVTKTLKSGWITSGPKTNELEEKYKIHGGKMIPNVVIPYYKERIDDNELYAIETYPSTGKGVGTLYNSSDGISHYMLNYDFRNII